MICTVKDFEVCPGFVENSKKKLHKIQSLFSHCDYLIYKICINYWNHVHIEYQLMRSDTAPITNFEGNHQLLLTQ